MAEVLFSVVVKRLESIIQNELDLLVGVTSELEKLSTTMTSIRAILQDAERKLAYDEAPKVWLNNLKDAAHCIEDILDKWTTCRKRDGNHSGLQVFSNRILSCFSLSHLELRYETAHGIKEIRKRLEQITAEKGKFGLSEFKEVGNEEHQATYLLNEAKIFGREKDRDNIKKFLISAGGRDFATIAIVGPEGMGKTTLAGYIYNNVTVVTHFQKRIWVSLSPNIQANRLAENIIAASGETYNRPSNPLHSLHEAMKGKRFLLILDNVWNEHTVRWDQLKATLEGGASGSRVVVTTRNQNAAVITSTDLPYTLSWLSDDACWSIFRSKAFHGRSESELCISETVGKEIVKKCKGNPLAAEAVGNVMLFKRTEEEWLSVLQGEILDVPDITKAGILSYENYPSHLKPCFTYFSLFPKGHTLSRDVLIKLWMAQNFIISRGGREEEDIGRDYFNELLGHSLFREHKKDSDGHVIQCIMHDLSHMLAQSVAKGECCTTEIERFDSGSFQGRHLSLIVNNNNVASPTPIRLPKPGNVRTLLVFSQAGVEVEQQLSHLINPLIHLRALDLSGTSINWLPTSIENLILLRYLNLSGSCIEEVPKSVTRLRNLQTLNLNKCQRLQKLSKGISKMVSLRHLEIEETDKLVYLPKGIGQLSSLRTLSKFTVDEMGKGCKMGELSNLNLLRGNLEMRNLGKVVRREDAEGAELKNKQFLRSLLFDFEGNAREDDGMMLQNGKMKMESVLMGLGPPHANLKELKICNYMGPVLPSWMEDSPFSGLVQLNLHSCRKFKQLPALGKLPSLKFLKIQGNEGVEVVGHEFYGDSDIAFPSLEELSFISLTNWEQWNLGVEDGIAKTIMPSLQELYIQNCPKLEGLLGHLPDKLRSIQIMDCKQLIWTPRNPPLHLHYLFLLGDVGILTMPLPSLPSLKNLYITDSPNQFLLHGIENLTALETLEINTCPELTSLTERIVQLRALKTFGIYNCRKLTALPGRVDRMPQLRVTGCEQYTQRPDRWRQMRALQAMGGLSSVLSKVMGHDGRSRGASGPFEKFTRVTIILPSTGQQYLDKVTENCMAFWKAVGWFTDAKATDGEKFKEAFQNQTFPPSASILFTNSPPGSSTIGFSKDGFIPEQVNAIIDNKKLMEAVLESITGKHRISPEAKQCFATQLSQLLKEFVPVKGSKGRRARRRKAEEYYEE